MTDIMSPDADTSLSVPSKIKLTREFLLSFQPFCKQPIPEGLKKLPTECYQPCEGPPSTPTTLGTPGTPTRRRNNDRVKTPQRGSGFRSPASPSSHSPSFGTPVGFGRGNPFSPNTADSACRQNLFGSAPKPKRPPSVCEADLPNRADDAWSSRKLAANPDAIAKEVKRIKGLLNKLSRDNYASLEKQILQGDLLEDRTIMQEAIRMIFENAVEHTQFVDIYAQLCHHIAHEAKKQDVEREENSKTPPVFLQELLAKCQCEFEARAEYADKPNDWEDMDTELRDGWLKKQRERKVGTMGFAGELYNRGLLTERVVRMVIQQLLWGREASVDWMPTPEDVEILIRFFSTVGWNLERGLFRKSQTETGKEFVDRTFARVRELSENSAFPWKVKFWLMDLLELRFEKNWNRPGSV
eukprot:NODE_172_length_2005_cov_59.685304_g148_i0.p1 GENE.NODE_172_length_2005_cov_59.685304_g148_i0~~NODE_172_length_2005_cov_59.685304_g148_i0.p1  ORF type:complete len:412 (+),score=48.37 NODE_172_length_2005_cov_59.685304_g148_i0:63-1298(+)